MNSKKIQKKLNFEEVFCIACRSIYLQPVTMPCGHTLCLECFKSMVDLTAYQCPMCRRRISNWLRKFKHDWDAMLNVKLWEAIKQQYPVEVQKRLNDEDDGLEERIVNHGFSRVEIKEGEIKKEFDDMQMSIYKEQEERELQNLEIAKKLQEEEVVKIQTQTSLIEELTREDSIIATSIQENIIKELHQAELILIQSDLDLATKLQNQISTETSICTKKSVSEKKQIKKGPLDKMFSKSTENNSKVQWNNTHNCSLSSTISSSSTKCEIQSSNTSLLNPCTSSTTLDSSEIFEDGNEVMCTCGRLLDNFTTDSPCAFCVAQIAVLNELWTQQQNDFLVAKDLEKKLRMDNFEDYNLRKRPSLTVSLPQKKKRKLSKGQLTLKQVLKDNGNTTFWK
ncbi:E3 ubiquitin-protein ligase rnf168 isoform X2 [Acyrthosiphon pisum]|uniref:RING-type E3 ubiquitin transferase n=1 Tax=Acyrthosiphon pisum TaxID=7029 RepID=A0A8R2FD79_ACYPI|nr:E3 ubiquitin-protein ligase rnf168 isoform X2 [Acyrthosiphon pisum]|eukprot:XP_008188592.2 PREDICTED: E3 ubiquitin-protein ligase RNF168 isoform X2 [Acyrthosiphon pisum]